MDKIIYFAIVECAAALLTALTCWLNGMRHKKPGWYLGIIAAVLTAILASLWDNGTLLFHPSEWSRNLRSGGSLLHAFLVYCGIGLIPGFGVVAICRGVGNRNQPKPKEVPPNRV